MLGNPVLDPGWYLGKHCATHHTITFQLAQLLGQHLLGDPRYQPLQLREALRPLNDVVCQHRLPLAADYIQSNFDRRRIGLIAPHQPLAFGDTQLFFRHPMITFW